MSIPTNLIQFSLRRIPSNELLAELEHARFETAGLKQSSEEATDYYVFLGKTIETITAELNRRRELAEYGAPLVPNRPPVSPELIKHIKERVSLAELIGRDIPVRKISATSWRFYGRCPVHGDGNDKSPSLVVYEDEGYWWCYGCLSGGDHISWLQAFRHEGFREALQTLCDMAGIPLPDSNEIKQREAQNKRPHSRIRAIKL